MICIISDFHISILLAFAQDETGGTGCSLPQLRKNIIVNHYSIDFCLTMLISIVDWLQNVNNHYLISNFSFIYLLILCHPNVLTMLCLQGEDGRGLIVRLYEPYGNTISNVSISHDLLRQAFRFDLPVQCADFW